MPAPTLTVVVPTRVADLDVNGHVNHAVYLVYMEVARIRFLRTHVPSLYGHVVVARTECDHHSEIPGSTEEVAVTVSIERVGRSSYVVRHELVDGDRPVALGKAVMVAVDEARRPRAVTDAERALLLGTG